MEPGLLSREFAKCLIREDEGEVVRFRFKTDSNGGTGVVKGRGK